MHEYSMHKYSDNWSGDPFLGVCGFQHVMAMNRYYVSYLITYIEIMLLCTLRGMTLVIIHLQKLHMYQATKAEQSNACICPKSQISLALNSGQGVMVTQPTYLFFSDIQASIIYSATWIRIFSPTLFDMGFTVIGLNHFVYFEHFFPTIKLMEQLLSHHIYACGTIMTNRKDIPPAKEQKKVKKQLLNRGDTTAFQRKKRHNNSME